MNGILTLTAAMVIAGSASASVAQDVDADMQKVLTELKQLGPKPLPTLTPEQARQQPTPADAAMKVSSAKANSPPKPDVVSKRLSYKSGGQTLPIVAYTPRDAGSGPLPVIAYFHGGGWVIADIGTYEASAKALAEKTGAIVASVEYRHAPEHKFPAAHEDAFAAYQWILENAGTFGGDPKRIAVAGESAGGNLAANVAIKARDTGTQMPEHMLLVYPVAGSDMTTPSYVQNANAKPLGKAEMQWFVKYALEPGDKNDPRINLVNADLKGLPPATVITAGIDPLRSEGQMLAEKLKAAGVPTTYRNFDGVTHEFFGMGAVVADAASAQELAAREIREAFDSGQPQKSASSRD